MAATTFAVPFILLLMLRFDVACLRFYLIYGQWQEPPDQEAIKAGKGQGSNFSLFVNLQSIALKFSHLAKIT